MEGDWRLSRPRPAFKAWLQTDEGYVFGPGVYSILKKVRETGTLKGAAGSLGMSYRYAWGLVKKAEETLGQPLVTAHKGGRSGGGGVELTELGTRFLEEFSQIESMMAELLGEDIRVLKLGPKNKVSGVVEEIKQKGSDADVVIKPGPEVRLVLRLLKKTIDSRSLAEGDQVIVEMLPLVNRIEKV